MKPGDPIWFRQQCRGGYGWDRDVPGHLVEVHSTRVTVRLERKDGAFVRVLVHPRNVRPRESAQ